MLLLLFVVRLASQLGEEDSERLTVWSCGINAVINRLAVDCGFNGIYHSCRAGKQCLEINIRFAPLWATLCRKLELCGQLQFNGRMGVVLTSRGGGGGVVLVAELVGD